MLGSHLSDAGEPRVRLKAGEGLCNPRVGRRFRRLPPCVVEMGRHGTVDSRWCVCELDSSSHVSRGAPERSGKEP